MVRLSWQGSGRGFLLLPSCSRPGVFNYIVCIAVLAVSGKAVRRHTQSRVRRRSLEHDLWEGMGRYVEPEWFMNLLFRA